MEPARKLNEGELAKLLTDSAPWGIVPENPWDGICIRGLSKPLPKGKISPGGLKILAAGLSFYCGGIRDSNGIPVFGFCGHSDIAEHLSRIGYAGSLLIQSSNVPFSAKVIETGEIDVVIFGDDCSDMMGTIDRARQRYEQKTGRKLYTATQLRDLSDKEKVYRQVRGE